MATAKISEYKEMPIDVSGDTVRVASEPSIATQSVTFTTSTASAAFKEQTKFIRVICDAKAHFDVGASPSANADSPYFPVDIPEYFGVRKGQKIAFYDGTS